MRRILGAMAACGTVLLAGAALAGCSGGSATSAGGQGGAVGNGGGGSCAMPPGAPVALAIGARSNNPAPSLPSSATTLLNSAINAKKQVSIVRLDGAPQVVFNQAFKPTGANSQSRKAAYDAYVTGVNQVLAGTKDPRTDIRAQAPQADVLGAIEMAADELHPAGGGDLIVLDSGLQTTAPLNFTTGLLADDPQTIVSYLKSAHELPNLQGISVEFSGLGFTASPQQALSIADKAKVTQIWQAIATAAGAACVSTDTTAPVNETELAGLPKVAVVIPPKPGNAPGSCSVTQLNDANNVGFTFDSTTFRNPAGARVTLRKLAKVILSTGESVTLTGATSSEGSDQYNQQLSLKRANAVKNLLVQLGVPASRISAAGDGSHLPGRLNDRGPNGQLLIGPAIQNRKVVAKLTGAGCHTS